MLELPKPCRFSETVWTTCTEMMIKIQRTAKQRVTPLRVKERIESKIDTLVRTLEGDVVRQVTLKQSRLYNL